MEEDLDNTLKEILPREQKIIEQRVIMKISHASCFSDSVMWVSRIGKEIFTEKNVGASEEELIVFKYKCWRKM